MEYVIQWQECPSVVQQLHQIPFFMEEEMRLNSRMTVDGVLEGGEPSRTNYVGR